MNSCKSWKYKITTCACYKLLCIRKSYSIQNNEALYVCSMTDQQFPAPAHEVLKKYNPRTIACFITSIKSRNQSYNNQLIQSLISLKNHSTVHHHKSLYPVMLDLIRHLILLPKTFSKPHMHQSTIQINET